MKQELEGRKIKEQKKIFKVMFVFMIVIVMSFTEIRYLLKLSQNMLFKYEQLTVHQLYANMC